MQTHFRTLILPSAICTACLFAGSASAADTAAYHVVPLGVANGVRTYEIDIDTAGQGVSAAEVWVNLPTSLHYGGTDVKPSAFDTEVTAPGLSGGRLHMIRASLTKDGLTGKSVPLARFTATGDEVLPTVDPKDSKLIRYTDSEDLLHPKPVATAVASAKPVSQPQKSQTLLIALAAVSALAVLGALAYVRSKRRR